MIKLEKWVGKAQEKKGFKISWGALYVCALFYRSIIYLRHLLYQFKIFKTKTASIPIISVGNIVCGGTGKSEFVAKLIKDLARDDLSILTRGYRARRKGEVRLVEDSDDGDEPFMLQQKCKKASVIVGKRRENSAKLAASLGKKAAILDDGMQYLRLKKDVQVVLVRADDPFTRGFVPYGMRRELLSKLAGVDFFIIHGAQSEKNYELVKRDLLCYSNAQCFGTQYSLDKINNRLLGKKVGVFCGIGNPQAFMKQLSNLDLKVVKKKFLADHQKFLGFKVFYKTCKNLGAEDVVCTTKDYVKLSVDEQALVTPIQISMDVTFDKGIYQKLIAKIHNSIERKTELNEG
ncbi:MAG: Tetraacyldisaccharide 4'-kinase [Chlamydiia bacterium]|nr:Tetraacyldisaccharide 4'-kinase [Chlamydiia bacterium]MCH9618900.1 Tetraacyldisaccharide 4'-kinase [Chlamydiia bacterium]MCH9624567.1 Tetraacyldisaccharide 4'-kinase [Chlamydiia bacterium]